MLGIATRHVPQDEEIDDEKIGVDPIERESSSEDYEIVIGRKQVASVSFIVIVLIAIFSTVSYLAGKSFAPKPAQAEAMPSIVIAPPPPPSAAALAQAPVIQATIVPPKPAPLPIADTSGAPIFADPVPGSVYIQIGAVDKGIGAIFAAGLRSQGFQAFVAPGPNDKIYRVLIGPLPDPQAYTRAKEKLDALGLTTFGKRVENAPTK